ncbi:hypothetical protein Mal15_26220 [Stieleria maiorica]|uniref:HIRAN domain-containing protein n=1 Tax=Stieleria maiorica TaxID=2795974 RepID=A0A5B9MDI5_9BACT|nr:hypothetical protein [Stieleria maiorica]QEF98569.1 hypothetical protein Mal15_26220 [Stieleria maiorica]
MKFLQRLLSKPAPPRVLAIRLFGPGNFDIEVSPLSTKSLDAFWKATSNEWTRKDEERHLYQRQSDAALVSDTEHRLPNAIRVEIAGKTIGHLSHNDALRLHRRICELGYDRIHSICLANLVGRPGFWDVTLDFNPNLADTKPASSEAGS